MDAREARWAAVYGAVVAEALAERRRGGFVPDQHEMRNIVARAWGAANEAEAGLEKLGLLATSDPGKVAPDGSGALKQRIRDLELERDLAIADRDTARAEARSQRKIAEDAQAGKVAP